jgi:chemotaxis signal transduction protein
MTEKHDIFLVKADVGPIRKREVFWALSTSQVEHIVQDLTICPVPFARNYLSGLGAWQGLGLPVVSLERYFGLRPVRGTEVKRRIVAKTTTAEEPQLISRLLIDVAYDVRIRPMVPDCVPVQIANGQLAARGLKGAYEWEKDALLLLPDLQMIASGGMVSR